MRKTEKLYSHKLCIPIVHRNVCQCCSCIVKWYSNRTGNRVLNKRMRKGEDNNNVLHIYDSWSRSSL